MEGLLLAPMGAVPFASKRKSQKLPRPSDRFAQSTRKKTGTQTAHSTQRTAHNTLSTISSNMNAFYDLSMQTSSIGGATELPTRWNTCRATQYQLLQHTCQPAATLSSGCCLTQELKNSFSILCLFNFHFVLSMDTKRSRLRSCRYLSAHVFRTGTAMLPIKPSRAQLPPQSVLGRAMKWQGMLVLRKNEF